MQLSIVRAGVALGFLLGLAAPMSAQAQPATSAVPGKERIEVAVAGVLDKAVGDEDVPGAVLVVVKDGRVIFGRGFGFANMEAKTPVDTERTLFYLASVTKTFTATAVMQMVENGRLDLRADVNTYLRNFQVDGAFPEPVTLAHLLTHTAGFDDKNIGYVARTASEAQPLGIYLSRALPPRVRPPGQVTAYSNHGYGLAGHLVEVISGKTYANFLTEDIFAPLGMSRTTATIPLPPELAADLATGYRFDFRTKGFAPVPLGYRNLPPAGTVSATASDMARFLIAHLQDGRFEDARILRQETSRQMHSQQFTHHPKLPGIAFGFYEGSYRRVRLLQHAGGVPGYAALVVLVPEQGLGIFVATNASAPEVNRKATRAVLDLFLPEPLANPAVASPLPDFSLRAARIAGCYQSTRYSRRSIEKIAIWDSQICVRATPTGTLRLEDRRGNGTDWAEGEPLVFRRTNSDELLAFREEQGRITYLLGDQGGFPTAFEKLSWWDSVEFQQPFALSLVGVLASTFTVWPLAAWVARLLRHRRSSWIPARAPRIVVGTAVFAGLAAVLLMAGVDTWIGNSAYRLTLVHGMSAEMIALLWLAISFAMVAVLLVVFGVQAWRRGWWTVTGRCYYTIVVLTALFFVVFLAQWNLLGFRY